MRRLRAELAYWLFLLALRIAPPQLDAHIRDLVSRVGKYGEGFTNQGPLRVSRPDGLSTSHGPTAPWND